MRTRALNWLGSALHHAGVTTVLQAPRDIHICFALRMLRLYGYSGVSIIFTYYLTQIGFPTTTVGLFMTLFLVGDMVETFQISAVADRFGRSRTLVATYSVMALTGIIFAFTSSKAVILLAGVVGFITPGGGEVGPMRNIELAAIANLSSVQDRSDYYTWYALLGIMAFAVGCFINGVTIDFLIHYWHLSKPQACRSVFLMMFLVSVAAAVLSTKLSSQIEVVPAQSSEGELFLDDDHRDEVRVVDPPQKTSPYLFDSKNFSNVIKLCLFSTVDAFGKTLVNDGWVSFYLIQKFSADATQLGVIFFMMNGLSSAMSIVGTVICKKHGPLFAMLITHVPATFLIMLVPLPQSLFITVVIILLRGIFKSMDMGSKNVFISAVVEPHERIGALTWNNLGRTAGNALAPPFTGYLTGIGVQWSTFVISGVLRFAVYEVGMVVSFWSIRHELEREKN